MKKTILIAMAILIAAISIAALAENRKSGANRLTWVDEKGNKHVTIIATKDSPPPTAAEAAVRAPMPAPTVITARIVKVRDMESIEIDNGVVIRYIGVKGPRPEEKSYQAAMTFHRKMVEGKWANILPGAMSKAQDGSTWSFVFIGKLTFVNAELIRFGHARSFPMEPNIEYRVLFDRLQERAAQKKIGIWQDS